MLDGNRPTEDNDAEIATYEHLLVQTREATAKLEEKLRLARGTQDITPEARQVVKTLPEQIEALLRTRVMSTDELAHALAQPTGKVFEAIKEVRAKVHNLGSPERARWSWRIGDDATTKALIDLVARLISDTPMTFRDVVVATGAREGRIQGVLVEVRRAHPGRVLDLGIPAKARWFMIPKDARVADLKHRRTK